MGKPHNSLNQQLMKNKQKVLNGNHEILTVTRVSSSSQFVVGFFVAGLFMSSNVRLSADDIDDVGQLIYEPSAITNKES